METVHQPPVPDEPGTLHAKVSAAYAPLLTLYEGTYKGTYKGTYEGTPQLEAVRAFLDERVAGDWTALARLLVDPASLPDPSPARLIKTESVTGALTALLTGLAEDGARTLLLAPTPEAADALMDDLSEFGAVRAERPGDEVRALRRQLLWLEQWPRDQASLSAAEADIEQRREALTAAERGLTEDIETAGHQIETVGEQVSETQERLTLLDEEHQQAAAEAAEVRAAWQELQTVADRTAQSAGECTRTADAAHTRYGELAARVTRCEQEREAARHRESTLVEELARTKEAVPEANRELDRLSADAADAAAEGHASYYRLAAAESARAAHRRNLSWGQRLHVAPTPPETDDLRHQVKARIREADEAGARARQATAAYEEAEMLRTGLLKFVSDGERELAALRAAQERLGKDIVGLSAERDTAYTGYQRHARTAAEAVDRATQAAAAARRSRQISTAAEDRAEAARRAQEEAATAAERAETEVTTARQRLSDLKAGLAEHHTDAAAEIDGLQTELGAITKAEARSRDLVREICEADPSDDLITEHRAAAMARIEELTTEIESAALVFGTPEGFATGPYARGPGFDVLIATEADRLGDADFLIGAIRARRWILIGDGQGTPELPGDALNDPALAERLKHGPYQRAIG